MVAPSENKSASSSSLTLDKPLKPIKIDTNIYSIDATPSDCVHLALCGFLEGRFLGLPSVAISLASWEGVNFETAGIIANQLIGQITHANYRMTPF